MNNPTSTQVRLRASTPAQLVATLPYLFGFRPDHSVIVIGLQGRRIEAAARVDASAVLDVKFEAEVLRQRLASVVGGQVIVVAWLDDVDDARRAAEVVVGVIGPVDMTVIVSDGRCQVDGGPWQDCADRIAEADEAGLTVAAGRAMIVASVAGPGNGDSGAAEAWASACEQVDKLTFPERRAAAKGLIKQYLAVPGELSRQSCLTLAALAQQGWVRDVMTAPMTVKTARQHVELWRAVVRQVPDGGAPAALGLLGLAAWLAGEGALQVCCVERGLAIDPKHSLLLLVETINTMGVHPREWARVRRLRYMGA